MSGPSAILLTDLPFAFIFIALVVTIATPVVWVLAIMLPLFLILAWRSASVLNAANREERQTGFGRDAVVSEMISGRMTVKALGLEDAIRPVWDEKHSATIKESINRGRKSDFYGNIGSALTAATTVSMTTVGALAIINQDLTVGALIAANMLAGRILSPFNQLVGSWRNFVSFRQAAGRLSHLFDSEEERQEVGIEMGRPVGEITVENVSFSYIEGGAPVIDNVRIQMGPNTCVTIMGSNGGGKTTLSKLLPGLYKPSSGRVLLDGADIAQFTRRELSGWIGYVPQEVFLFAGSIRDNVAKARPDASDEEVMRASKLAGLHDFLIDLPDGYATDIGEAGHLLPGGMRQRVAIARALVGDPPVIMMDETSSNLDRQGEQELYNTLIELAKDHTVIVITHSQALLAASQQVLVLQRGKIVRSGKPQDVLPELLGARAPRPAPRRAVPSVAAPGVSAPGSAVPRPAPPNPATPAAPAPAPTGTGPAPRVGTGLKTNSGERGVLEGADGKPAAPEAAVEAPEGLPTAGEGTKRLKP